jgi:putative acetyltransferase
VTVAEVDLPESLAAPLAALIGATFRPVTDDDAHDLIQLIGSTFAEYPGCVLDLDGLDADLRHPTRATAANRSVWWVVEHDGRVVATIGAGPQADDGSVELKRLYVAASHRRRGLARGLVALVERSARRQGATSIELWSDTRFDDAHKLYRSLGYHPTGDERELDDPSETTEYRFTRTLEPGRRA